MTADTNTLYRELLLLVGPLRAALRDEFRFRQFMAALGWNLDGLSKVSDIKNAFTAAIDLLEDILGGESADSLDDVIDRIDNIADVITDINNIDFSHISASDISELPIEIAEALIVQYLIFTRPVLWSALAICGIAVNASESDVVAASGDESSGIYRIAHRRSRLHLKRIGKLLSDPVGYLSAEYPGDASAKAQKLFPRLQHFLTEVDVQTQYGLPPALLDEIGDAEAREIAARSLTCWIPAKNQNDAALRPGVVAQLIDVESEVYLAAKPFGSISISRNFKNWDVEAVFSALVEGFAIGPSEIVFTDGAQPEFFSAKISAARVGADGAPAMRIGGQSGTRLEIGGFEVSGRLELAGDQADWGILIDLTDSCFYFSATDGDGFLNKILSGVSLEIPFDLGLGFDNVRGIYLNGSATLEADIPVNMNLLDVVSIKSINLGLLAKNDGTLVPSIGVSSKATTGIFDFSIDNIGLKADLEFPDDGGNLGMADLSLRFKPPSGASISIDTGYVTGGGYLEMDFDRGRYAGLLYLSAPPISITAAGIITTKPPDDFSLLIMACGTFSPLQLGFGFTLSGVGGLIGLNRTMAVDDLRTRVKTGAIDSILFPEDPLENPQKLIADLDAIFPAAKGRTVLGPMLIINYGTPALISAEIGILLDLPNPIRIAVLGQITLDLPSPAAPTVHIRLDIAGILDFEKRECSVDASLFDSHIAGFPISGDMALRLGWGGNPVFIISLGGCHPSFAKPPGFPSLNRMAITLASKPNLKLRVEGYLALTSNTVQFGARLDAYAGLDTKLGTFSVEAYFAFDTLITIKPFGLVSDLSSATALKRNGKTIITVTLYLHIEGPGPWRANGYASFNFLRKEFRIPVDVTVGRTAQQAVLTAPDPSPMLREELEALANWSIGQPQSADKRVLTRIKSKNGQRAHPAAPISVRQRVLPMDRAITRIGNAPLPASRTFSISRVEIGGTEVETRPLEDLFAAAQFFNLNNAQKLAAPQFEAMPSGVQMLPSGADYGTPVEFDSDVEEIIIDKPQVKAVFYQSGAVQLPGKILNDIAFSSLAAANVTRFFEQVAHMDHDLSVEVSDMKFVLAEADTLAVREAIGRGYFEMMGMVNEGRVLMASLEAGE